MARFVKVTDEYIKSFSEQQENENTKKKTLYDLRIFNEFLLSEQENREIHTIPPKELQDLVVRFVLGVRKKNGEEYEPSSIRAFLQSVDRHLRKNGYSYSLLNDKEFNEVQDILKKKQKKQLKSIGKGNKPNSADPITDELIEQFHSEGILGNKTPRALLNTVWMNNCVYFGMRPGKEQRDLCWGDLQLKTNTEGVRYVEFAIERQTKTRTGENPRNVREKKPKMYEKCDNPDRCPVLTYLAYKEQRPSEMMKDDSPFYLAVNLTELPRPGKCWFKASPLGVNSLRSMVKNMLESSQIQSDKKLVNHSTRKHLIQKLVDNNIPANEIVQITGHKNINSLNNYSAISDKKQQQISDILSGSNEASSSLAIQPSQRITTVDEIAVSAVLPATSAASQPVFHQCQIGTVNVFTNDGSHGGEIQQSFTRKRRRVIIDSDESQ